MALSRIPLNRRRRKSPVFSKPVFFVFLIFLAYFVLKPNSKKVQETTSQNPEISSVSIPAKETSSQGDTKKRNELLVDLNQYIDSTPGTYGIYVYELDSGKEFGINEQVLFPAAS